MKLFAQKEEIVLSDEDKGAIADHLTKHTEIWKVQVKYLSNKMNFLARKMAKCKPEELKSYQDRIALCQEIISDHEFIKKDYLKINTKRPILEKAIDIWHYITSQDTRDSKGNIRLAARQ